MKVSRRGFLKIGGLTIVGLAIKPAFDMLSKLKVARASPTGKTVAGKRWAMVINLKACLEKDGCRDSEHRRWKETKADC